MDWLPRGVCFPSWEFEGSGSQSSPSVGVIQEVPELGPEDTISLRFILGFPLGMWGPPPETTTRYIREPVSVVSV